MQKDRNPERRNSTGDEGGRPEASHGLFLIQHTHTAGLLCCCRMVDTLPDSFCFFSALC